MIELLKHRLPSGMSVASLRDAYPAGDEFILVYDILGRVIPPGGIPLAVNAVVMNVETAVNIAASAFQPVTEKFLTIAGAVAQPVTLRVPIGVTLEECVAAAGGPTIPDPNYMVGGVMMGTLQADHQALVDKTTGGVIVLPDNHSVIMRRQQTWKQVGRIGRSACDQCSFCTELCPRWLLGHPIEPHKAMRSLGFNMIGEANTIGTSFCCECNLCSLYSCPEDLDPKQVCTENKRRLSSEKKRWENPPFDPARAATHLKNRKAPMARLINKLGLRQFNNVVPLQSELLPATKVGIKLKQHIGLRRVRAGDCGRRASQERPDDRPPAHAERQASNGRARSCFDRRHGKLHFRRHSLDSEITNVVAESDVPTINFFRYACVTHRTQATQASPQTPDPSIRHTTMNIHKAVGAIEFSSVGIGYLAQDEMLKSGTVDMLIARTICSGKYLVVVGGTVSDVEASVEAGIKIGTSAVIDELTVANIHEAVFPALGQSVVLHAEDMGALGVVETFSGVSILAAADAAAKAARVIIFRIHIAMALGGKGLLLMTGTVSDVRAGVDAAAEEARSRGLLVSEIVIPRPSKELFAEYL